MFLDANDLVTPAKQQVTQYFYDAFGQNIKTIDAEGNTTFASYDHFGNRSTFTDANGGITTFTYDNDNRVLTVTDPEGFVTANTYDSVGNRISVRDANGHTVVYVYSRNNLLVTVTDPSADGNTAKDRVSRNTYDVVGNRTTATDANGNTTTYTFREDNRVVAVTTPSVPNAAGQSVKYTTSYAYDGVGNRISVRDNNGNLTQYVYDPDNLLVRTTDAIGQVTQYSFDANLNRVSVVMGAQLAPPSAKCCASAMTRRTSSSARPTRWATSRAHAYDAPGNRISTTDALRAHHRLRIRPQQPPASRDAARGHRPGHGAPVRYTVQHQFDANGNEIATTDENGHVTPVQLRPRQPHGDGRGRQRHQDRLRLRQPAQPHLGADRRASALRHRDAPCDRRLDRERPGHDAYLRRVQPAHRHHRRRGQCAGDLRQHALPESAHELGVVDAAGQASWLRTSRRRTQRPAGADSPSATPTTRSATTSRPPITLAAIPRSPTTR